MKRKGYGYSRTEEVIRIRRRCAQYRCLAAPGFWTASPYELYSIYNGIGSTALFPALPRLSRAVCWLTTHLFPTLECAALPHDWDWRDGRPDYGFKAFMKSNVRFLTNGLIATLHQYRIFHPAFWALPMITFLFFILVSTVGYFAWRVKA